MLGDLCILNNPLALPEIKDTFQQTHRLEIEYNPGEDTYWAFCPETWEGARLSAHSTEKLLNHVFQIQ